MSSARSAASPPASTAATHRLEIGKSPEAFKDKTLPQVRIVLSLNKALNRILKFRSKEILGKLAFANAPSTQHVEHGQTGTYPEIENSSTATGAA